MRTGGDTDDLGRTDGMDRPRMQRAGDGQHAGRKDISGEGTDGGRRLAGRWAPEVGWTLLRGTLGGKQRGGRAPT